MAAIFDFTRKNEQRFLHTLAGKFVDVQLFAAVPDGDHVHVLQYTEVDPKMVENMKPAHYHYMEQSVFNELFHKAANSVDYNLSKHFAQAGAKDVPAKATAHLYMHHIDKVQHAFAEGGINGKNPRSSGRICDYTKGRPSFCLSLNPAKKRIWEEVDGLLKPLPF